MPYRQLADAGAQSTVSGAITAAQTTVTLLSATGFPGIVSSVGQLSVIILDSGNPAYSAASPLATPYEYQPVNNITGNVLTFGLGGGAASRAAYAGTTPRAYFAGATIAVVMLAEDIQASTVWKFATQSVSSGTSFAQAIPTTFRHIDIIYSLAVTGSNANVQMQLNGDTGNHYYWASDGAGSDGSRSPNGGVAVNSALVGFVGTSTALTWDGRIRLNDTQQGNRRIGWSWEGTYGNVSPPNLVAMRGGGEWFPSPFAALTSVTIFITGGTFTSSTFDYYGYP